MNQANMKLKIRPDCEAGLIKAWLATTDETTEVLISTLHIGMAEADHKLFQDWKEAAKGFVKRETEKVYGQTVWMHEIKKNDQN